MRAIIRTFCSILAGAAAFYLLLSVFLVYLMKHSPVQVPFRNSDAVLADFSEAIASTNGPGAKFVFGLATAPAHVEDELEDAWLEFAMKGSDPACKKSPVRAWHNQAEPHQRLRFWTEPDIELQLARDTGVESFRMGVDWGRIVPVEPAGGTDKVVDRAAVEQYRQIMERVKAHNMTIMLTLFHHSLPKWAVAYGGWTDERTLGYFREFARLARDEFGDLVDMWVTFNEPHIFSILTYCAGTWPPGLVPPLLQSLTCLLPIGAYGVAMDTIGRAHMAAFEVLHEGESRAPVGVAHHVGVLKPYSALDAPLVMLANYLTLFPWIDQIQHHLDFCGLNYYGQEFLSLVGLQLVAEEEYSEAGRGVYPDGLYLLLMAYHRRYGAAHPHLRYIITENGIADAHDNLRRPYLVEHLLALHAAIAQGVPVDGYFHWTISDNWEWADGYCPKFGLASVNRQNDMERIKRPSYHLFTKIVKSRQITRKQREEQWGTLQMNIVGGKERPFCRSADYANRMWADGLDAPITRPISQKDWRFGAYRSPSTALLLWRGGQVLVTALGDAWRLLAGKPVDAGASTATEKLTGAGEL